jgi:hypothetical protein
VPDEVRRQIDEWADAWLTASGFGRFDLSYFRHTRRWFTVLRGLMAAECFKEIEQDEVFWPMT